MSTNNFSLKKKVLQFEKFINNVLKADLTKLSEKLDEKNADLAEFIQLKTIIETFKNNSFVEDGFKTKVDLGQNFFIQAHVDDPSTILMDVGLGYFVEFTLDDAVILINVRTKLLESQIENIRKEVAKINAYIKLLLLSIRDIQGIK